jgi:hypothetical protein
MLAFSIANPERPGSSRSVMVSRFCSVRAPTSTGPGTFAIRSRKVPFTIKIKQRFQPSNFALAQETKIEHIANIAGTAASIAPGTTLWNKE